MFTSSTVGSDSVGAAGNAISMTVVSSGMLFAYTHTQRMSMQDIISTLSNCCLFYSVFSSFLK